MGGRERGCGAAQTDRRPNQPRDVRAQGRCVGRHARCVGRQGRCDGQQGRCALGGNACAASGNRCDGQHSSCALGGSSCALTGSSRALSGNDVVGRHKACARATRGRMRRCEPLGPPVWTAGVRTSFNPAHARPPPTPRLITGRLPHPRWVPPALGRVAADLIFTFACVGQPSTVPSKRQRGCLARGWLR